MKTSNDIRRAFFEYFERHDHTVVPSSPLVPHNDPTLMFVNAGMVPFKNVFTGVESRDYERAASSQKCVRAGGKHNDLDNVGYTSRHHTFFEMLGNFSFGNYFKEQAIELAWGLITKEFDLEPNRLVVTVFETDDEAYNLWKRIAGLSDDRLIRISTGDNFWAMGDTGPCGPCSEIFFDHGEDIQGGPPGSPEEDGDRFVELWNLVFMQYDQIDAGTRKDLPRPSIDTGMGLERITSVLQGTHDVYQTDLLRALIEASAEETSTDPDGPHMVSHRVIADHLRSTSFLIADGVLPSNEGRGYVLRRIMRRAMRHAHLAGAVDPLMYRLVDGLVAKMGQAYPELGRAQALIVETLKAEEIRFKNMLGRGLKLLDDEMAGLPIGSELSGEVAFKLYDTYGFPVDLTEDVLRGTGRMVDSDGFEAAMDRQRAEARKAWTGSGATATEAVWFDVREESGPTEFLGYDIQAAEGQVLALLVDGERVDEVRAGQDVAIVTNQTPFYGESGGQVGDTGRLSGVDGLDVIVTDTKKVLGDLHVHIGCLKGGKLTVGDVVDMRIEYERRQYLRANHSATHLLHKALRSVLGDHVTQKGSLVAHDRLRFDISHPSPLSDEEIDAVETAVNEVVRQNAGVSTRLMTPDEAVAGGALALFGEKYGDEVRVVAMGDAMEAGADTGAYSVELCGGTHVRRTGDIGLVKVVGQSAVASGVRRIEGLTGGAAVRYVGEQQRTFYNAAAAMKVAPAELEDRVIALIEERKRLERELSVAKRSLAMSGGGRTNGEEIRDVQGIKLVARQVEGVSAKDLRALVDETKNSLGSGIAALIAVNEGKAAIAVGVTDDLTDRVSAVDLVRVGAEVLGGKGGGGRPDMAQAGGPDGGRAGLALEAIEQAVVAAG